MRTADNTESAREPLAMVILPCTDLQPTLAFFMDRLGFRLDTIFPADKPRVAEVSGYGVHLRLEQGGDGTPGALRLLCTDDALLATGEALLMAPNGTRVELVDAQQPLVLPPARQSFVISRMRDNDGWQTGRANMRYRDLIVDRQGGHIIASHIQIPDAGPVPDYVHFHKIHFQMIYCYKGWVRVVYEDQGEPFVMQAGDCVLQPPAIRHRVLESSAGLEVIEVGCPAEHETCVDHDLSLPNVNVEKDRRFAGQRFQLHIADSAAWHSSRHAGMLARDIGIAAATSGVATAQVLKPDGHADLQATSHDAEFLFTFILCGSVKLRSEGKDEALAPGDSFVLPAGQSYAFAQYTDDLEMLEVALPGSFATLPPTPTST